MLLNDMNIPLQRMWFTEDTDKIYVEKLEKGRTGHFTKHDLANMKHRSKA